jgi:hypothetical protein
MEEEKKQEEKREVSEEDLIKLAKLELGSDHTAKIFASISNDENKEEKIEFEFSVHVPTYLEELKIVAKEDEIGGSISNFIVKSGIRMIATLDVVTDKIKIIDTDKSCHFYEGSFWEMIQKMLHVTKIYQEVIFPVFNKFIEFRKNAEMDFKTLKNVLAQIGKK